MERIVTYDHRHSRLIAHAIVESVEERSNPRKHDAPIHDVEGELGRGPSQRALYGANHCRHRLADGLMDLAGEVTT